MNTVDQDIFGGKKKFKGLFATKLKYMNIFNHEIISFKKFSFVLNVHQPEHIYAWYSFVSKMVMLKFLKVNKDGLPDPKGFLSSTIPSHANAQVKSRSSTAAYLPPEFNGSLHKQVICQLVLSICYGKVDTHEYSCPDCKTFQHVRKNL